MLTLLLSALLLDAFRKCHCRNDFILFYCIVAGSLQSGSEEEQAEDASSVLHHDELHNEEHHHHDDDASLDGRRRRRSFYTQCQLAYLESTFRSVGHYPDQRQRQQLARSLSVTENRVQVQVLVL